MLKRMIPCLALLAACERPLLSGPDVDGAAPIIVSNPVFSGTAAHAAGRVAVGSTGGTTYVSLPPQAVPLGTRATIVNRASGRRVVTPMVDGGFDPVAIPADEGDELHVTIEREGGEPLVLSGTVAAVRRPVVVRTDPPPRRRDVPLNARIIVVFSEPIDSASLNAGTLRLQGATPVAGTIAFGDAQHLTAVFVPAVPLAASTTYRLVITDGVRDLDGDALDDSVEVEFSTAASSGGGQPPTGAMSRIAFVGHGASGHGWIYTMNADGSDVRMVVADFAGWGTYDPAWSPDGSRLAFVSQRHAAFGGTDDPAIYVSSAGGSGITRLTYQGSATTPAWSPDGRKIAFTAGALYVMNADGSGVTRVTNGVTNDRWGEPTWSPDGTRIAFVIAGNRSNEWRQELYVVNADGSGLRRLLPDQAGVSSPAWSPDGTRIAYSENGDIYVIGVDGSAEIRLTDDPGLDWSPTWSPDGTMIAFLSTRTATGLYLEGSQIFVMNADGSDETELVRLPFTPSHPDWSRSGYTPVVLPPGALSVAKAPTASGDAQADTVRATLRDPLRVRVLRRGAPAAGVTVTWSVGEGLGSVSAAATTTDADGIASVSRTLGDWGFDARFSKTIARVAGATGSPVVFSATALPGHTARLTSDPGDTAGIGAVNSTLGPVRAIATDAYGNTVTGVRIVWAVASGGGSITPAGPDTTGNEGNGGSAWARFTLGPDEGEHVATATAPGIPGAPVVRYRMTAFAALVQVGNVDGAGWYTVDFSPDSVAVPSGGTVAFLWGHTDLTMLHNVTFDDDPTEPTSSPTMGNSEGGEIFLRKFTGAPRTIHYRCTVHGETGTVTVLP